MVWGGLALAKTFGVRLRACVSLSVCLRASVCVSLRACAHVCVHTCFIMSTAIWALAVSTPSQRPPRYLPSLPPSTPASRPQG